jgi:hypothetical protein
VVAQGYNWVRAQRGVDLPALKVRWTEDKETPEKTSYYDNGSTFYINSRPANKNGFADPDEFDDTVIAHELNHFVIMKLSKSDSPGGNHDAVQNPPTQAWDEGLATALGLDMVGQQHYYDTTTGKGLISCGTGCRNIEADKAIKPGTSNKKMTGKLDEFLVSSIVYDMLDGANEAHDKLPVSYPRVLGSLFDYLKQKHDRQTSGVDLVDFLDGWRCRDQALSASGTNSDADLRTLLEDKSVNFPYDFKTPVCK